MKQKFGNSDGVNKHKIEFKKMSWDSIYTLEPEELLYISEHGGSAPYLETENQPKAMNAKELVFESLGKTLRSPSLSTLSKVDFEVYFQNEVKPYLRAEPPEMEQIQNYIQELGGTLEVLDHIHNNYETLSKRYEEVLFNYKQLQEISIYELTQHVSVGSYLKDE